MDDFLNTLEPNWRSSWPAIAAARELSKNKLKVLEDKLGDRTVDHQSQIVVYGSLARGELSEDSDLDWTLLVDGQAENAHALSARTVEKILTEMGETPPGATNTFGQMTFSHDLVHRIGGISDDNFNMTRRVLLLLESTGLGTSVVRDRVFKMVLKRYVEQDVHLRGRNSYIPRFLLNDIVRFWRTMAVDYASKTREQDTKKWALRNIKLRNSRKFLYYKGLLVTLAYHKGTKLDEREVPVSDPADIERLSGWFNMVPVDTVAAFAQFGEQEKAMQIISHYDKYLAYMKRSGVRDHLATLKYEDAISDAVFEEGRLIGRDLQKTMMEYLFDRNDDIPALVKEYGIF